MAYRKVNAIEPWKPEEEGATLRGTYVKVQIRRREGGGNYSIFVIELPGGELASVSGKVIESLFSEIDIDDKVKIEFKGWQDSGEFKYRKFELYVEL